MMSEPSFVLLTADVFTGSVFGGSGIVVGVGIAALSVVVAVLGLLAFAVTASTGVAAGGHTIGLVAFGIIGAGMLFGGTLAGLATQIRTTVDQRGATSDSKCATTSSGP